MAPLLCAGAIGYRSLRLTNLRDGQRIGLTGFGSSVHLVLKLIQHQFRASARTCLRAAKPSGRLVINAIRKENHEKDYLLRLNYPEQLWMEKEIKSVANVTRSDVEEFLPLAAAIPIQLAIQTYPLAQANEALWAVKQGQISQANVLVI